jgi:Flp pilus assembly pilin Flp
MLDLSRLRLPLLRRRAAGMVEYGALIALIAVAALGAVMMLGQRTGDLNERTADILVGDAPHPGAPAGEPLQGVLPEYLVWSPPALAFALSPAQPSAGATATLTNTGGGRSLPFSPPQISGPDATAFSVVATDCPDTLGAGESCAVTVEATAASNGARAATLGAAGAPGGISLSAVAAGFDPLLAWSTPAAVAVDGTPGPDPLPRTHVQTLTLTNVGFADAPGIAPAVLAASGATVALTHHDCPAVLLPSASCTVQVTVAADDNGPISATLTSGGSGPTQPVEVVLTGSATGFAPAFAWSGGGAFTLTAPSSNPATVDQTFTLTNTGTLAGTPAVPTVSGGGPGYNFFFSLASHDCTGVLAVGGTCSATVRATYTDNVAAATGTLGGPATLALTGSASGFAAVLAWIGMPADFALNVSNGGVSSPTNAAAGPTGTATLSNTGTLATGPVTVAFVGDGAEAYELTPGQDGCTGQSLTPGSICTVGVRLRAGLFPGDYALQLSASASSTVTSSVRQQRVLGPRLTVFDDNARNMSHGYWDWSPQFPVRQWLVRNVGNQPTHAMNFQPISGQGMNWAVYSQDWETAASSSWDDPDTIAGPNGTIVLQPNEFAILHMELQSGWWLYVRGLLAGGTNVTFAGSIYLGGFFVSNYTATYFGPVSP